MRLMPSKLPSFLFCAGLSFSLFGLLAGGFSFWDSAGHELSPSASYSLIAGALILVLALGLGRLKRSVFTLNLHGYACGLTAVFLSDWLGRSYSLFQGPSIRGEIIVLALISLACLRPEKPFFFSLGAWASILILTLCFLAESQGRTLFSDDHPTFIYRLNLLKHNFPAIPFYHPFWNAGVDARDFFATGSLNVFFLTAPLVYLFDLWHSYNYIIALVLFGLVPLAAWGAAKVQKLAAPAPAIAAILALTSSLTWYRWALKYGTVGFVVTAALVPLNLSLGLRLLSSDTELKPGQALLFVVSATLMLLWPPAAVIFVPVAIAAFFYAKTLLRKKYFGWIAAALLALNIPWMTLLWSVSNVGHFLKSEKAAHEVEEPLAAPSQISPATPPDSSLAPPAPEEGPQAGAPTPYKMRAGGIDLRKSLKILREKAVAANPLLVFLLLPGLLLLPARARVLTSAIVLWLVFLGAIIVPLKPQLEFDRMLLVLALCAGPPVAAVLSRLLNDFRGEPQQKILPALCFGFLLGGPFSVSSILLNRTLEQYYFAEPIVQELSSAIKTYGGQGRVLVAGFILHHLSNGHIAPLTYLSGKPLIASSQYHDVWRYKQVIPRSFLKRGDQGIQEYLDLLNVTAIVAHEKEWRDYFLNRPDKYKMVWHQERFLMFQRLNCVPNYAAEGAAQLVEQNTNSISVRLQSSEALLKFNYFPFLTSSACKISGQSVAPELTFIKLSACPLNQTVTIKATRPWRRIFIKGS